MFPKQKALPDANIRYGLDMLCDFGLALLVVKLVVGQLCAAFGTGTKCAGATFTAILTDVVPYAGRILSGFGCGSGLVVLKLHRGRGLGAVGGVVGLVVGQLCAAFGAGTKCAGAAFATVGAGIVPYALGILGRLGSGGGRRRGLRSGGCGITRWGADAFGGGIAHVLVVAAGEENSESTEGQKAKKGF